MLSDTDLAATATLIGDPTRAQMLGALLSGSARSAGDLAREAGVSPATASEHLSRLLDGQLVVVESSGRHRFYRLADERVATALEMLATISPTRQAVGLREVRAGRHLAHARSCYDHLAGYLGVLLADGLVERGVLAPLEAGAVGELLDPEHPTLGALGVAVPNAPSRARRPLVRGCLDWTERRPHVAGGLGAAVLSSLFERDWVRRRDGNRSLLVTDAGVAGLRDTLGIDATLLAPRMASRGA